ncbi:MAG: hypothetical protein KGJ38_00220 [Burkholderiaceae bacterium]|nr:hypothetical protein [Burkholderiaceae bacterium]
MKRPALTGRFSLAPRISISRNLMQAISLHEDQLKIFYLSVMPFFDFLATRQSLFSRI